MSDNSEISRELLAEEDVVIQNAKWMRLNSLREKAEKEQLNEEESEELDILDRGGRIGGTDFRLLNGVNIRAVLDINPATLTKWIGKGCPCELRGGRKYYDAGKIFQWRINHQQCLDGLDTEMTSPVHSDALEEFRMIKAKTAEFDLRQQEEKFIATDQANELLNNASLYVRNGFKDLPGNISIALSLLKDPNDCIELVETEINRRLKRLSELCESEEAGVGG